MPISNRPTTQKALAVKLNVPTMRFSGGELVCHIEPNPKKPGKTKPVAFQHVTGLYGKLELPRWCNFGPLGCGDRPDNAPFLPEGVSPT